MTKNQGWLILCFMNKIVQMFFEICLSRLECMHTVNENQGCLPCENVGASTNIIYMACIFVL